MSIVAMITFNHRGDFRRTDRFLKYMTTGAIFNALEAEAQKGVQALASVTPVDTGYTADSWSYLVEKTGKSYSIIWVNSNIIPGHGPLVIMLEYGHGTGTGGYVQGRRFIVPAIEPIFDEIANTVWREVENA